MLGSQLVMRALRRHGVRVVFSLSGNQIMPLYDACIDAGIRIVHVRHEAAAVFMADAWSQVTGEIGVAMLTAGPGICNGLSPLYSALQAESPLLLLSGDSPVREDGMGAFQELDQAAMTRPLTKSSRRVVSASDLLRAIDDAVVVATTGRPGPVHLALPFDVITAESGLAEVPPLEARAPLAALADSEVHELAERIARAQRPVIIAGPASARGRARDVLRACGRTMRVPVVAMESPRGFKDPSLGSVAAQIAEADVVVAAGKAVDFTLDFGRVGRLGAQAKVVVLDADSKLLARAQHLLGPRLDLFRLCDPLRLLTAAAHVALEWPERADWNEQVSAAMASRAFAATPAAAEARGIGPAELCRRVQQFLADAPSPIVVCDGGEFGQWAQAFCSAPVRIINGPSGAIGGGLCYAIAAKLARPECTVVALMGDGTSGFHFIEFDTAVREKAPFIAVIGNDDRWNAEYMIQLRSYGVDRLIGCTLSPTARYDQVAMALGGYGARVERIEQVDAALRGGLQSGLPSCINVAIEGQPAPAFGGA
jgi:acetolactate synthase-1/2/3 large subunit